MRSIRSAALAALTLVVSGCGVHTVPAAAPGVEVLLHHMPELVEGRRAGLITNHTAVDRWRRSSIDLLHHSPRVDLVALFAPEHGLRGDVEGGYAIPDGRDARTGLPILSLYGETQRPTPEMLEGIEVLLFDMQDVGARPYTYVWTMVMAMEEAAAHGIPFVVLDRPNPITRTAEGPLMGMEVRDRGPAITGYYPVPLRHGLTPGELARYVNAEFDVGADLHVAPVAGWAGNQWFDETGLPWVSPSPNIRSLEAAIHYAGLVMLETVQVSVGRGTEAPFSYVGAPWLDRDELLRRLGRDHDLPGVAITPATFVPEGEGWVPYRGQTVHAVRLDITDREAYRPVLTALTLLWEMQRMHPEELRMGTMLQMLGSEWAPAAVREGVHPAEITRRWEAELEGWEETRDRYRIYPFNR
jgi:uncharacterized protein YbbC (DUF1343 family)